MKEVLELKKKFFKEFFYFSGLKSEKKNFFFQLFSAAKLPDGFETRGSNDA